jgi:hypothetical protein
LQRKGTDPILEVQMNFTNLAYVQAAEEIKTLRAKFLEQFERTMQSKEWLPAFSKKGVSTIVGRKQTKQTV